MKNVFCSKLQYYYSLAPFVLIPSVIHGSKLKLPKFLHFTRLTEGTHLRRSNAVKQGAVKQGAIQVKCFLYSNGTSLFANIIGGAIHLGSLLFTNMAIGWPFWSPLILFLFSVAPTIGSLGMQLAIIQHSEHIIYITLNMFPSAQLTP